MYKHRNDKIVFTSILCDSVSRSHKNIWAIIKLTGGIYLLLQPQLFSTRFHKKVSDLIQSQA